MDNEILEALCKEYRIGPYNAQEIRENAPCVIEQGYSDPLELVIGYLCLSKSKTGHRVVECNHAIKTFRLCPAMNKRRIVICGRAWGRVLNASGIFI